MTGKDRHFHHNIVNLNCLYDVNDQFDFKYIYLDDLKHNNKLGDYNIVDYIDFNNNLYIDDYFNNDFKYHHIDHHLDYNHHDYNYYNYNRCGPMFSWYSYMSYSCPMFQY